MNKKQKIRSVAEIVESIETLEGAGFLVRRPFPTQHFSDLDPFLLLDEMGPIELKAGEGTGAPDHPHRGFETVTYLFSGRMEHKDSQGNSGKLTPGDVQWMTAGSGVIHSEMTEDVFSSEGGKLHGVQLWINLPQKDKMMNPRYQDIPAQKIPTVTSKDGKVFVKVIAGESLGAKAVIETRTPIMYLHVTIQPGGNFIQTVPEDFNAFAYIINGTGNFGETGTVGKDGQMVVFENNGDHVSISSPASSEMVLNLLLIGGRPLHDPVVRYGPFVMNTEAEIHQAISDFRTGRFGEINF